MSARGTSSPSMSDVGEKGFLADLLPRLTSDPSLIGGLGHDAATVSLAHPTKALAHKIDRAPRPVALDYEPADFAVWGLMAVTTNCSDVLASGASPVSFMLGIIAPPDSRAVDIERIIFGAAEECGRRGIVFSGGDLKEGPRLEVIGTAVGVVDPARSLPRTGVEAGDVLYCAGRSGGFAASRLLLDTAGDRIDDETRRRCIDYLAHPAAQWDIAERVNGLGLARAAMDASDGLYEVFEVLAGAVGLVVDLDGMGYHPLTTVCEAIAGFDRRSLIFGAGDWNIVYAVPPDSVAQFEAATVGLDVFRVGKAGGGGGVSAMTNGVPVGLLPLVHEHFRRRIEQSGAFLDLVKEGVLVWQ
jgi:thiamine-monophosphate kinase